MCDVVDNWLNALDNMGPYAPKDQLLEHLDNVPDGVDPKLVAMVQGQVDMTNNPMSNEHGDLECGIVV